MRESHGVCAATNHGNTDDSSPFCLTCCVRWTRRCAACATSTTPPQSPSGCSRHWSSSRRHAQLTCVRRGATCGRAAGVRTPGTRACVCLRPRHALASVLSPASQGAHAPDTDAIVSDRSPGPGNSMACRRRLRTTCVRRFACEGPMLRNLHGIGNTYRPLL